MAFYKFVFFACLAFCVQDILGDSMMTEINTLIDEFPPEMRDTVRKYILSAYVGNSSPSASIPLFDIEAAPEQPKRVATGTKPSEPTTAEAAPAEEQVSTPTPAAASNTPVKTKFSPRTRDVPRPRPQTPQEILNRIIQELAFTDAARSLIAI